MSVDYAWDMTQVYSRLWYCHCHSTPSYAVMSFAYNIYILLCSTIIPSYHHILYPVGVHDEDRDSDQFVRFGANSTRIISLAKSIGSFSFGDRSSLSSSVGSAVGSGSSGSVRSSSSPMHQSQRQGQGQGHVQSHIPQGLQNPGNRNNNSGFELQGGGHLCASRRVNGSDSSVSSQGSEYDDSGHSGSDINTAINTRPISRSFGSMSVGSVGDDSV